MADQHSVADPSEDRTSEDEHEEFLDSQEEWDQLFDHFQSFVISIAREPRERPSALPLAVEKRSMSVLTILDRLSKLVQSVPIPVDSSFITEPTHFYSLSSGVAAYLVALLGRDVSEALSAQFDTAVSQALQALCRLPTSGHGTLSADLHIGRLQALQAAVRARVGSNGVASLSQPVVYARQDRAEAVVAACLEIGLPASAVCALPAEAAGEGVSLSQLSQTLSQQQSEGRTPLAIFASVDATDADDVRGLGRLASQFNAWLHVEGDCLPLLACVPVPECVAAVADAADSFSGQPGSWFRLPDEIVWTYFKTTPTAQFRRALPLYAALPLHLFMQRTGLIGLAAPFQHTVALAEGLRDRLASVPNVVLSPLAGPAVKFRFLPSAYAEDSGENLVLLNRLTEQIQLDLSQAVEAPIELQLAQDPIGPTAGSYHSYIVFNPLQVSAVMDLSDAVMETLAEDLRFETSLIDATLSARPEFAAAVSQHAGLRNVHVDNFVGLGAVRYVPLFVDAGKAEALAKEIESLNAAIGEELAKRDPLFSAGVDANGLACTCLGVDTNPLTPESIRGHAQTIMEVAVAAEKRSNILEKVADIIRLGISSAQAELEAENREQLQQEGVLRQLPIVGGWYNWAMPIQKAPIKGRSFDLTKQELKPSPVKSQELTKSSSTDTKQSSDSK